MTHPHSPNAEGPEPQRRPEDGLLAVHEVEGLQLHAGRNLFQLAALVCFACIGAAAGWFLIDDRPDIAALVGAVLGAIAGTFLSGLILMNRRPPPTLMTAAEFVRTYKRLKRRAAIAALGGVVGILGLGVILRTFGNDESDLAWVVCLAWILSTVALLTYANGLAGKLREWKCPSCGKTLARVDAPCRHCGFSLDVGTEQAIELPEQPRQFRV